MIYHGSRQRFRKFNIHTGGGESTTGRGVGVFFADSENAATYHIHKILKENWGIVYECQDVGWMLDAEKLEHNEKIARLFHKKTSIFNSMKMKLLELFYKKMLPWPFYVHCVDKCPIILLVKSFVKLESFNIQSKNFALNTLILELDAISNPHARIEIYGGKFKLETYNMNGYGKEILLFDTSKIIIIRRYLIRQ